MTETTQDKPAETKPETLSLPLPLPLFVSIERPEKPFPKKTLLGRVKKWLWLASK